jgi:hypothetical protein
MKRKVSWAAALAAMAGVGVAAGVPSGAKPLDREQACLMPLPSAVGLSGVMTHYPR